MRCHEPELPGPGAAFARAVNAADLAALVATFARRALVNDQLREYRDRDAIVAWAARDVVGQRLSMRVRSCVTHHSQSVVTAELDGCFDKRGLPDPLVVTFYFSSHGSELVQLVILRNEVDT